MTTIAGTRVAPSDINPKEQSGLDRMLSGEVRPVFLTASGDVVEFPKAINDLFVSVVQAVSQQHAVFLMQEDEALTTQAAANYLGISRQFFVRLLDQNELPFHRVGTHRRVFFKDLVAFQLKRTQQRKAGLDQMTEELVDAGLYDRYADLTRAEDQ